MEELKTLADYMNDMLSRSDITATDGDSSDEGNVELPDHLAMHRMMRVAVTGDGGALLVTPPLRRAVLARRSEFIACLSASACGDAVATTLPVVPLDASHAAVHAVLWELLGASCPERRVDTHRHKIVQFWERGASKDACAVCNTRSIAGLATLVCAYCAVALQVPVSFDKQDAAWWGGVADAALAFATYYQAPCIIAHYYNLLCAQVLPLTAPVLMLSHIMSERQRLPLGGGGSAVAAAILRGIGPRSAHAAWNRLYDWNIDVQENYAAQRRCGTIDVKEFGAATNGDDKDIDDDEEEANVPRPKRACVGEWFPRGGTDSDGGGASGGASGGAGGGGSSASGGGADGGAGGDDGDSAQVSMPVTIATVLKLRLITDAHAILERLCAAFPVLGTPDDVAALLAAHPNLVLAGGAVGAAANKDADMALCGDVDAWVLDPVRSVNVHLSTESAYKEAFGGDMETPRAPPVLDLRYNSSSTSSLRARRMQALGVLLEPLPPCAAAAAVATAEAVVSAVATRTAAAVGVRTSVLTVFPDAAAATAAATRPLQVVHSAAASLSHLLWSFDLPHVQAGLRFDAATGAVVCEVTVPYLLAIKDMMLRSYQWKEIKSTPERLTRAAALGFTLPCKLKSVAKKADPLRLAMRDLHAAFRFNSAAPLLAELARLRLMTSAPTAYLVGVKSEDRTLAPHMFAAAAAASWAAAWKTPLPLGGFTHGYAAAPPHAAAPPPRPKVYALVCDTVPVQLREQLTQVVAVHRCIEVPLTQGVAKTRTHTPAFCGTFEITIPDGEKGAPLRAMLEAAHGASAAVRTLKTAVVHFDKETRIVCGVRKQVCNTVFAGTKLMRLQVEHRQVLTGGVYMPSVLVATAVVIFPLSYFKY